MKYLVILSFLILVSNYSNAQGHGGFGGPTFNFTFIDGKQALEFGGAGAAVLGNLVLGGYGSTVSDFSDSHSGLSNYKLQANYGGLWFGYIENFKDKFNILATLKLGSGKVKLTSSDNLPSYSDNFKVVLPEIAISRKLNSFAAFQVGVYYKLFNGVDFQNYKDDSFSNFGFSVMIKFGGGYF